MRALLMKFKLMGEKYDFVIFISVDIIDQVKMKMKEKKNVFIKR